MMYKLEQLDEIDLSIVSTICSTLQCSRDEICDIEPIKAGLTNITFSFKTSSGHYVYRYPGQGTSSIINRESEAFSELIAKKLGIDNSFITMDSLSGWKLCRYVEGYEYIDPQDYNDRLLAMKTLHSLHDSNIISEWDFDYCAQTEKLLGLPLFKEKISFERDAAINEKIMAIGCFLEKSGYKKVLCHNDSWAWNMLKDKNGKITFIDWEYSGNSYPAADVAYFTGSYDSNDSDYLALAELYEGHSLSDKEKKYYFAVMAIVFWYWYVWALYKEALGKIIPDKKLWYNKAIHALEKTGELK